MNKFTPWRRQKMVETSTSKKCYIKYPFRIGDHLWRPVSSFLFLYLHMIVFVDIPTLLPVPLRPPPNCSLNSLSSCLPLPARNAVKPEVRLWSQWVNWAVWCRQCLQTTCLVMQQQQCGVLSSDVTVNGLDQSHQWNSCQLKLTINILIQDY